VVLTVQNLRTENRVSDASFDLRRGEVMGLGGVLGSGRTEIGKALFGEDRIVSGTMIWKGRSVKFSHPSEAIAAGFALVPENRKFDGLFFNFEGFPNLSSAKLSNFSRNGILSLAREAEAGRKLVNDLEITPAAEFKTVGFLSGGNQQKIVIGRWLFADAELFILDEPTQGIDIGAKIAVYKIINDLTRQGKSVILISSDHDELIAMSDRIAIVSHGRITAVKIATEVKKIDLVKAGAQLVTEGVAA
jgi:ribose transport system ATP-binding protein